MALGLITLKSPGACRQAAVLVFPAASAQWLSVSLGSGARTGGMVETGRWFKEYMMTSNAVRENAASPEDIPRLFRQFVAAGDFGGLATLYEPDAVLALPPGEQTRGNDAIAEVFRGMLDSGQAGGSGGQLQPVLYCGDLALTSTRLPDGRVTVEVARRQADGSWRWVIDQPHVVVD